MLSFIMKTIYIRLNCFLEYEPSCLFTCIYKLPAKISYNSDAPPKKASRKRYLKSKQMQSKQMHYAAKHQRLVLLLESI